MIRLLSLLALAQIMSAMAQAQQRNVLLIIADDYGIDSSSLYNTTPPAAGLPPTPNIAALATGGIKFQNAYACPVCSPTRAAIMTGRRGFRTGVGDVIAPGSANGQLTAAETTLPEVFAANPSLGYSLAMFGKWHLATGATTPYTVGGWPYFAGTIPGALTSYTNYTKIINNAGSVTQTANYSVYATTDVRQDAATWISQRTGPWFAWVAFNAGHTPFHVPPTNLHSYGSPTGNRNRYEASIEAMDTEIGNLLASVNRSTTMIIFIGDNGTPGQVIQSPYNSTRAKGSLYEGGTRVPFIINGPDVVSPGRTVTEFVHVVDLFATILDIAGIPSTAEDSRSLKPLLQNQTDTRDRSFNELFSADDPTSGGRTLRDSRYKLARLNNGTEEFYDLQTDPYEATNLISVMTTEQQSYYHRLKYELGSYTTSAVPAVTNPVKGTSFSMSLAYESGKTYTLWRCTNLAGGFWAPVSSASQTINGATITLTDPTPPADRAFYSAMKE